jgi:hypothetical protein
MGIKEDDGLEIAVKVFKYCPIGSPEAMMVEKAFQSELEILKSRNSLNGVVRYFGVRTIDQQKCYNPDGTTFIAKSYCIALELMETTVEQLVLTWKSLGYPDQFNLICFIT